jgi:hypothetical protein
MAGFVNQTPYGVSRPPVPKYGDIGTAFSAAWDDVMLKHADVTTRFTKLATEAAGILK